VSEPKSQDKPFGISKWVVWEAYQRVKANKGAAGVDDVSIEEFEQDRDKHLYRIWNRMSSGSYFPPPVKAVGIPKPGKKNEVRVLGVPTIADRVAQTVARMYLEPKVEPVFHPDSYGYRPKRSALDAVGACRERCWRMNWVIDLDIKKFFDSVPHDLVLKAVEHHTDQKWILLYVRRWLQAPMQQPDGTVVARDRGTPQGSAISPLLANLFMHYAFDTWMAREFPDVPFERYVDDVIVHCVSEQQARRVKDAIASRLADCGGLRLHPDKTRIVYCKDSNRHGRHRQVSFDFLGYTFKPRSAKRKDGTMFTAFTPAISGKAAKSIRGADPPDALSPTQRPELPRHRQDNQRESRCVGGLLRALPPVRDRTRAVPHRPIPGAVGHTQVQTPATGTPPGVTNPGRDQEIPTRTPRPLEMGTANENNSGKSRMTGAR
jgi:RNA-directed DNA polymerase